ncbi:MAG: cysteine desulfurase [Oleiphilus sp.]|nr:MAG: cysteine desulfurase [Oleiphilus sp.]
MIYLDSAASYPLLPEVKKTLIESLDSFANPSSSHKLGEMEFSRIEEVRSLIADRLGALRSEILFTSGATESNNLAVKGCVLGSGKQFSDVHLVTSQSEHKCILNIFSYFESLGCHVTYLKPEATGVISADQVRSSLRPNTLLVSLMHVNNELGVINPIEEISNVCFEHGVKFHTDAAQSFCKVPVDVLDIEADFVSITAHKIGGPKGVGALYVRDLRSSNIMAVIHGAGQEEGLRGGTLPSSLIAGFGEAIKCFPAYYSDNIARLENILCSELGGGDIDYIVNGGGVERVKHITSITLPKLNPVVLVRETENEFCIAQGSACSSREIEPSHVLAAIGLDRELASKTFRLSYSHATTEEDIKMFAKRIGELSRE